MLPIAKARQREKFGGKDAMSEKLSGLNRRLAKIERQLILRARREELANGIFPKLASDSLKPEELGAEMNKPSPARGIHRLGILVELMGRPSTRHQLLEDFEAGKPSVGGIRGKSIRPEPRPLST